MWRPFYLWNDNPMTVTENFEDIKRRMKKAERGAGRKEGATQLVAVTKTVSDAALEEALASGHRVFGENRVQEAAAHWADLKTKYPDIKLHLIGPLQTNKAKDAVALFDVIETLDREKLVDALSDEMKKQGKDIPCFVQVNTGDEEQKAGIAPRDVKDFLAYCKKAGLTVTGLMCIPPVDQPAGLHFAFLKDLARQHGLSELSMGMSADFEKAIRAGATFVRVGTALFGAR